MPCNGFPIDSSSVVSTSSTTDAPVPEPVESVPEPVESVPELVESVPELVEGTVTMFSTFFTLAQFSAQSSVIVVY